MTEYFEVHERDGAARLGELRLDDPLQTPALVDDVIEDGGSLWSEKRTLPSGNTSTLTVLPHRGFPAGTAPEVQTAFEVDYPTVDFPSAVVVSSETARNHGSDAYVLSSAPGVAGNAAAFAETIVDVRQSIPADTAVLLSGVATPANVATLAYSGVDLFDSHRAYVRGLDGFYQTTDGERFLEDLEELPCSCPACQQGLEAFDREDCAEHNVTALQTALARVRERIRSGRLRTYIEGQARHEAWLTALLRRLDDQYAYLEQRTPIVRSSTLLAASEDSMRRVEIQRFADRVCSRYRNRFEQPLVLVPCSARKPYSSSQSHGQFHDAINYRAHKVSMTSPIGVVPQELEYTYPAQQYDSVVTGRWSKEEIDFVARVLTRYLERNEYPRYIAHVPPGGYRSICEQVEDRTDIEFEYTVDDHPTTAESLETLRDTLAGESKYRKREREHNTVRAIADYQFGSDAGSELFGTITVEGQLPSLRIHAADDHEQLATIVPQYGTLALTLAGVRRWGASDVPTDRVEIDPFVPQGSVLAPGIERASESIRVGDEVLIEGPKALAVGRAAMSGPEMNTSTRGIAVEVRHVEER
ncbi:archaeosine synthase subunit alpha [Halocatena salina]|uniref:Archaeosine synthase subunit alpha n=1 Tax=Halocatena salina TaxID=2934340 RepID=A0A8U0A1Z9_9EURY|nr:archaeosine synthase subunit alpha [Halocatena salina]UPM43102.1 archaeosine synthase subunit alpha [Halocatena salina]